MAKLTSVSSLRVGRRTLNIDFDGKTHLFNRQGTTTIFGLYQPKSRSRQTQSPNTLSPTYSDFSKGIVVASFQIPGTRRILRLFRVYWGRRSPVGSVFHLITSNSSDLSFNSKRKNISSFSVRLYIKVVSRVFSRLFPHKSLISLKCLYREITCVSYEQTYSQRRIYNINFQIISLLTTKKIVNV